MCPWFDYIVCIGGKSFKIETLNNVYALCICKKASLICYPIFLTWEIALEFVPLLDAVKITLLVFLMFRNVEIILQLPCNNNKQTTNQKVYSWSNFNHKLSWCLINRWKIQFMYYNVKSYAFVFWDRITKKDYEYQENQRILHNIMGTFYCTTAL